MDSNVCRQADLSGQTPENTWASLLSLPNPTSPVTVCEVAWLSEPLSVAKGNVSLGVNEAGEGKLATFPMVKESVPGVRFEPHAGSSSPSHAFVLSSVAHGVNSHLSPLWREGKQRLPATRKGCFAKRAESKQV